MILALAVGTPVVGWMAWRAVKRLRDPEVSGGEKLFGVIMFTAGCVILATGFTAPGLVLLLMAVVWLSGVRGFTA